LPALASTIDKKLVKKGDESRKIDKSSNNDQDDDDQDNDENGGGGGEGCLVLQGHESEVHQISWKPGCGKPGTESDGNRLLASCSFDQTAKLWDADEGTCLYTFSRHQDFVYSIAFEPTLGRFLATGSNDGTVQVWRIKDKALVLEYESPAPVYELTFNPPGTQIAVTGQLEQVAVVPFDPVASFNA
jgi:transducin (beta)-like 1